MGLDPASAEARRALALVRERMTCDACGPDEAIGGPFYAGEVIARDREGDAEWTKFAFPTWWHYNVLRVLDWYSARL